MWCIFDHLLKVPNFICNILYSTIKGNQCMQEVWMWIWHEKFKSSNLYALENVAQKNSQYEIIRTIAINL